MKAPTMSTYILTIALAGVGGWALSQELADDAPAPVAALAGPARTFGAAPQAPATPIMLNLTTPPTTMAPVMVPQRGQQAPQRSNVQFVAPTVGGTPGPAPQRTTYVINSPVMSARPTAAVPNGFVGTGGTTTFDPTHPSAPMAITASNGAIVYISQQGNLIANTGATSTSGIVALGVQQSDLGSGRSSGSNTTVTSVASGVSPSPTSPLTNSSWQVVGSRSGDLGSVAISGFEDHSVSVLGDDQVTTYDDSNVFLFRNGDINANTGDTDSSGLNAVDVWDSRVRAGNSGDGEDVEEAEVADSEGAPVADRTTAPTGDDSDASNVADTGSDDDDENASSETGAEEIGSSGATVSDEGASTAVGAHSLVVGADGYDDVSIRTQGNGNITTYDDSNVVIGGTGHVNAQIGDSDTGGTVVMGIHGSDISGGCEGDLCTSSDN